MLTNADEIYSERGGPTAVEPIFQLLASRWKEVLYGVGYSDQAHGWIHELTLNNDERWGKGGGGVEGHGCSVVVLKY